MHATTTTSTPHKCDRQPGAHHQASSNHTATHQLLAQQPDQQQPMCCCSQQDGVPNHTHHNSHSSTSSSPHSKCQQAAAAVIHTLRATGHHQTSQHPQSQVKASLHHANAQHPQPIAAPKISDTCSEQVCIDMVLPSPPACCHHDAATVSMLGDAEGTCTCGVVLAAPVRE